MANRPSSSRQSRSGNDAIGQFLIDEEIGKGSFAQVYSGRHKVTGGLVAIKSVDLDRLNKKLKENLYGEIKILTSLRHPHIVALHDCVETKAHINLIMEYCELGDLSHFIKKRGILNGHPGTQEVVRKYPGAPGSGGLNEVLTRHFLQQLASAIQFLRQGNFVHRDVKPQNLLLLPSPQWRDANKPAKQILSASYGSLTPTAGLASLPMLKLADFGFARVLPSTALAETLCGSPLYMAPEILRYEKYDAKADLWSVGTVLYEMTTGKPPFRASNHVELLRKIEAAEDSIRFTREAVVSPEMKQLVRALLKRNPTERMSFDNFFAHPVVTGPIPGLVEDDIPKEARPTVKTDEMSLLRRHSIRRYADQEGTREPGVPPSPKPRRSSPLATPTEAKPNPMEQVSVTNAPGRMSYSPRQDGTEGLGIRRPTMQPSATAPSRPTSLVDRTRRYSNTAAKTPVRETPPPASSGRAGRPSQEDDKTAQDVAFERDYVVVDKKHLEVNALADQISMYPQQPQSPRSGQVVRRATQQGHPTSTTGAVPASARNMQVTGRNDGYRPGSYEKAMAGSPGTATSVISKAIQDASLRLFGFKYSPQVLKGQSPPQIYNPFPTYPTPSAPLALIGDGKQSVPVDEDARVAQCIEDYATRSDVVYGFAEVKYKQLVPLAPSMEHGLGGVPADKVASEEEEGLTTEAIVSVSEEALVLYVKALSLLAKSMDIASLWWSRKTRPDSSGGSHSAARDMSNSQSMAQRINSAVQWIRSRFNEVLEKAEVVRLKLIEAQKQLPEDHPSYPGNHPEAASASASGTEGVFLTVGISAEKLMYERALEMSRAAAIDEIANDDLAGCEISYVTAIRMLEAVLDQEDDYIPKRRLSGVTKDEKAVAVRDEASTDMNSDDQQSIQKVIGMINIRLSCIRKKMQMIARASKAQQQQSQQQTMLRRRSGDMTSRSVPSS
ncbi:Serine/threonine-protein kinase ATG1 [Podospora conica]|nr:Serine/threonine-protein kinase ATG1 [Schizothecium conicum]